MSASSAAVSSVFRRGLFANKTAIVTGGGTGIGKAITQELLYLGCRVVIASRKIDRLTKTAEEIKKQVPDSQIEVVQCNIRNHDQVKNLMSETIKRFGGIDYLVNNGGGQFVSTADSISPKGWNAVIETNLTGTFHCCQEVYDQWMRDHGGAIVNIIADMFRGFPGMCHTGAARAGVENITKTLALEWIHNGVRVNAVAPGTIYSSTAAANYPYDVLVAQKVGIPAKRLGTVEEVSAAVLYLLSPAAGFISGATLKVDGSQSLYATPGPFPIPDHKNIPAYTWEDDKPPSKL